MAGAAAGGGITFGDNHFHTQGPGVADPVEVVTGISQLLRQRGYRPR